MILEHTLSLCHWVGWPTCKCPLTLRGWCPALYSLRGPVWLVWSSHISSSLYVDRDFQASILDPSHGVIGWNRDMVPARVRVNMQTQHLFQQWGPCWYYGILNADILNICITTYCTTYLHSTFSNTLYAEKSFKTKFDKGNCFISFHSYN